MAGFFKKKLGIIRFCISLGAAVLCTLGVSTLLLGPRLGPYYDFLLKYRRSAPVSGEIVLIETGTDEADPHREIFSRHFLDAQTAASVLMILTETETSSLIIQVPVLSTAAAGNVADLGLRFDEEFDLVQGNILNLFEAIRTGSVPPSDAPAFVEELLNLTERGKERLLSSFIPREEADFFEQASLVFGRLWKSGAGEPDPQPDPDGVLRRVVPVDAELGKDGESLVYAALKDRYQKTEIQHTEDGPVLYLEKSGEDPRSLPLDKNGAFLIEKPEDEDFKRIPLSLIARYEEEDRALYRLLTAPEAREVYRGIRGEDHPTVLYEYALSLREELLRSPEEEKKRRWLESREGYFESLEAFCYGPGEMILVARYEELIAGESPEGEEARRLRDLRDEYIRTFREIREKYDALTELRDSLKSLLYGAFCILGPGGGEGEFTELEASAVLANSLISGNVIKPAAERHVLFWSLVFAGVLGFFLARLEPFFSLAAGSFLTFLIGAGFSWSFVLSAYWIDPLIPASAAAGAVLSSTLFILIVNRRFAGLIRRVYGNALPPAWFRALNQAGVPPASEPVVVPAVIIAVRNEPWVSQENLGEPGETARAGLAFQEELFRWCVKAGGIMAGWEGDTALIAFGSPPERMVRGGPSLDNELLGPVTGAVKFLDMLLEGSPAGASWYFGIDAGKCAFVPIPGSGYRVYGPPVFCSRLLSKFASRHGVTALVTRAVREQIESIPVKTIRIPVGGKGFRLFYAPLIRGTTG